MNILERTFVSLNGRGYLRFIPDELCLRLLYRIHFHKKLNLNDPKTYNEKLQWLKLHDRKPFYPKMVDKYEAKKYVAERIGDEYIIPTLGVWDHFEDIDFGLLPQQFVLKCTHDSGGLVICKDKKKFDYDSARKKINRSLKHNYYWAGREWPYKTVKPRIIAEQYMEDSNLHELKNYKIFTFNEVAKTLFVSSDCDKGETDAGFFDGDFKHLEFNWGSSHNEQMHEKPAAFEKMIQCTEIMAQRIVKFKVDFYEVDGNTFFGELTFFDGSSFDRSIIEVWDNDLGKMIDLPDEFGGGNVIIGEQFVIWVHSDKESWLTDYKFFCFNGEPKIMYRSQDKAEDAHTDFFDMEYNHLPIRMKDPNSTVPPEKPDTFETMKKLAFILCQGHPHLRVDFYNSNERVYVGELTFYHCSGFAEVHPNEWNLKLGEWIPTK